MTRRLPLLLIVLLAVVSPAAAAGYSVSPDQTTEVPTRTVTFEGQQFDISTVGRVSQGTQMTMTVGAPDNAEYTVLLYNPEKDKLASESATGTSRIAFPTDRLAPGTYGVVVSGPNSQTRALQPVVVEGYDISLDAPESFDAGAAGTFSVTLTATASSGTPESVGVAIANESWNKRATAEQVSDGEYEASISVPAAGEYRAYAAARGTEKVYGKREALAITGVQSVEVDGSSGGGGGGFGGGGGGDDGGSDTEQTTTSTADDGTTTASDDGTTTASSDGTETTAEATTTGSDGVLTPSSSTPSNGTTASPGTPGFTLSIAVAALAAAVLALRRGDSF